MAIRATDITFMREQLFLRCKYATKDFNICESLQNQTSQIWLKLGVCLNSISDGSLYWPP
jgi:hypothetical protein